MENKLTKKDKFQLLRDYIAECETEDKELFLETLDHEIELLDKKRSKPSKEDEMTIAFRARVLAIVSTKESVRASDLLFDPDLLAFAEEKGFPLRIQRVTSALTKLTEGDNSPLVREVIKKVAYFRVNPDYIAPEIQ